MAKCDIAAGETVDAASIETRLWVADLLPADAVRSIDDAVGKKASSAIVAGEVLSERRFGGEDDALDVPEGLTAVSVPAKDVQAVGGADVAGSRVDMYATGGTSTDVIARSVLVLATSAGSSTSDASVTWITVAVAAELVQEIVAAAQKTELYFTLPGDGPAEGTGGSAHRAVRAPVQRGTRPTSIERIRLKSRRKAEGYDSPCRTVRRRDVLAAS